MESVPACNFFKKKFFLNFTRVLLIWESFPSGSDGKEFACNVGDLGFNPWVMNISWRREWLLTQYSCLENSTNRGTWWATVHESQRDMTA